MADILGVDFLTNPKITESSGWRSSAFMLISIMSHPFYFPLTIPEIVAVQQPKAKKDGRKY
jgi:hypothetical protein